MAAGRLDPRCSCHGYRRDTGIDHARSGPLIRRCRRLAGLTQKDLAERTGLSMRAIRNPARGRVRRPRRERVRRLVEALDLGRYTDTSQLCTR
jgi:transcriptional regulator with XRE-family HTH domain